MPYPIIAEIGFDFPENTRSLNLNSGAPDDNKRSLRISDYKGTSISLVQITQYRPNDVQDIQSVNLILTHAMAASSQISLPISFDQFVSIDSDLSPPFYSRLQRFTI